MKAILYCGLLCIAVCISTACSYKLKPNQVIAVEGRMIPIEASIPKDPKDVAFLEPYKTKLDREMSEQIACAAERLEVTPQKLENKLSNFAVDMVYQMVAEQTRQGIDLAMLNVGGLRAPIAKGEIRIRDIYSVFPFDNKLALIKIKGKDLRKCLPAYQHKANGVANARIEIKISSDSVQYFLTIAGKPLEDERVYTVATIDYLTEGNDGFVGFSQALDRIIYEQTLRDAALQYVSRKFAKGECIDAPIEGRVSIKGPNTIIDKTP